MRRISSIGNGSVKVWSFTTIFTTMGNTISTVDVSNIVKIIANLATLGIMVWGTTPPTMDIGITWANINTTPSTPCTWTLTISLLNLRTGTYRSKSATLATGYKTDPLANGITTRGITPGGSRIFRQTSNGFQDGTVEKVVTIPTNFVTNHLPPGTNIYVKSCMTLNVN